MLELNNVINELSKDYDSYYVYDEHSIVESIEKLKTAFPDVTFLYSIKCNHNRNVIDSIFSKGLGADAASLGEVMLALDAGLHQEMVCYSAPGKSDFDIREAWDKSRIIVDSIGEIGLIEGIADEKGCSIDIGVRITRRTGRIFSQM